jgi:hypothetical protein
MGGAFQLALRTPVIAKQSLLTVRKAKLVGELEAEAPLPTRTAHDTHVTCRQLRAERSKMGVGWVK